MSNFKIWIDDDALDIGGNTLSNSKLDNDIQRKNGFKAGTEVSSIRVNSLLRQNSLVSKALMDMNENELDCNSSLEDVKNTIKKLDNYIVDFTQSSSLQNIESGEQLKTSLGKISKQLDSLSNFMKDDGLYASDDTSKGTIEQRLTNLGFEQGTYTQTANISSDVLTTSGTIYKQGKMASGSFNLYPKEYFYKLLSNSEFNSSLGYKIGEFSIKPRGKNYYYYGIVATARSNTNIYLSVPISIQVIIDTSGSVYLRSIAEYSRYFYGNSQVTPSTLSDAASYIYNTTLSNLIDIGYSTSD